MSRLPYLEPLLHQLSLISWIVVDGIRPIVRGVFAEADGRDQAREESGKSETGEDQKRIARPLQMGMIFA